MATEEIFDVEIDDTEAARLVTVDDVISVAGTRLEPAGGPRCATQMSFHALRRFLTSAGVARSAVRPTSPLSDLLPLGEWRARWSHLGTCLDLELPSLALPSPVRRTLLTATATATGASLFAFGPGVAIAAALAGGAAGLATWGLLRLPQEPTLAALARSITDLNYGTLVRRGATWRPDEAFGAFRSMAARELGIPAATIGRTSTLHDLMPDG